MFRTALALAATIALSACGGGEVKLADDITAKMRAAWEQGPIEREPLCIEAGPFPYQAGRGASCDRCQELAAAGLLVRGTTATGRVSYDLSGAGKPLYRLAPDPEFINMVRARFESNPASGKMPPASTWNRPRMCFGRTRFHSIAAALPPMDDGGVYYHSIKLVAVAEDTSGLLFDPRIAALGLKLPPRPEAGQPALYPPEIVTFEIPRLTKEYAVTTVRYGPWALED